MNYPKLYLSFLLSLNFMCSQGQPVDDNNSCNCKKDFAFVVNYLEHHYSGFQDNVTNANHASYDSLKNKISQALLGEKTKVQCLFLMKDYIHFFRDRHLQIYLGGYKNLKEVDEKSEKEIQQFKSSSRFLKTERVYYDSTKIWKHLAESQDQLEGIYENEVYQIAVTKNKNETRDYVGIITGSKTPLWEKGQVKVEAMQISAGVFQTVLYTRNHLPQVDIIEAENPLYSMNFKKKYPRSDFIKRETATNRARQPRSWFQFKVLNDSTTYLRITSFDGALKRKFDSAYKKTLPIITRKSNLVIDIRDNGGGSDICWSKLYKSIYTSPFAEDRAELFCSEEIIKRYEESLALARKKRKSYGWKTIAMYKYRLKEMRKAPSGSFIPYESTIPWWAKPFVNFTTYRQRKVYPSPKKVIVMFNRHSGSAAEGLIRAAQQSKKVLTFGENSGGYTAYGDIMFVETPSGFTLGSGTHRIPDRVQYEIVGMPPQIRAREGEDWIEQTQQLWRLIKPLN